MSIVTLEYKSLAPCNVIAPIGAFGNHLRWLLLLDSRFSFVNALAEDEYKVFAGPDWPSYINYCTLNYTDVSPDTLKEIQLAQQENFYLNVQDFTSIDKKLNFIENNIYFKDRTYYNWLAIEYRYREILQKLIYFDHKNNSSLTNNKTVGLIASPKLALRGYLKFNSSLIQQSPEDFFKSIERANLRISQIPNSLFCSADLLFSEKLDIELYNGIVNWLGLDNLYQEASYVHKLWYNLHKKAEKDFLHTVSECYSLIC